MADAVPDRATEMQSLNAAVRESHARSTREALLEHARMGRSVCEGTPDGGVIWIPPTEIFARYGLDEFGRPKA